MAAKINANTAADLNLKKVLAFLGAGVAVSGVAYYLMKNTIPSLRNSSNMEGNGPNTDMSQVNGDGDIKEILSEGSDQESEEEEMKVAKKVLLLGLESSGKSSVLFGLQMNAMKMTEDETEPKPTEGFHVVCIQTGQIELNIWEIGGAEKMRKYWSNFTKDSDVLVYVVDSSATDEDLRKAGEELKVLLEDSNLTDVPLVILAHKQDLPGAKSAHDVKNALQLPNELFENRQLSEISTQAPFHGTTVGLDSLEAILIAHG